MPSYLRNLSFADILVLLNPWPRSSKAEHNNRNVNLNHILDLTGFDFLLSDWNTFSRVSTPFPFVSNHVFIIKNLHTFSNKNCK